jgi:hypothetical protein
VLPVSAVISLILHFVIGTRASLLSFGINQRVSLLLCCVFTLFIDET